MDRAHALAIARYNAKRYGSEAIRVERIVADVLSGQHEKQRPWVSNWHDPVISVRCGRRAGKSEGLGSKLMVAGVTTPKAFSAYVTLTKKNAKDLMWPILTSLNDRYNMGGKPYRSDLTMVFPNKHTIFLGGAENEKECEKYRQYKYKCFAIDECGAQGPWLKKLVVDIAEPACIDVGGQIVLSGTPGPVCDGFFWESSTEGHEDSVPTFHWTCLDNPFLQGAAAYLARLKKRRGWDDNHPTYMREWMGLWVPDWNALCFPGFHREKNAWDGILPNLHGQGIWEHTLAIDVGYDDATSFTDLVDSTASDKVYVKSSYKEAHLELSAIFQRARDFCAKNRVRRIVVDASGGGGKNIVKDWQKRFNCPVQAPGKKKYKRDHIALVNNAFSDRRLLVNIEECGELVHEMATVCWDDRRKMPDPRYPNDCTDGLEYGYMQSYHYAGKPPTPPKSTLTPEERYEREAEELEAREVRKHRKAERDARRRNAIFG